MKLPNGINFVQNQMHHHHGSPEMMTNGENCFINTVCVPYFNSCMCELYIEFALCNGVEVYMALCALSLKYCVLFFGALIYFRKKKKKKFDRKKANLKKHILDFTKTSTPASQFQIICAWEVEMLVFKIRIFSQKNFLLFF